MLLSLPLGRVGVRLANGSITRGFMQVSHGTPSWASLRPRNAYKIVDRSFHAKSGSSFATPVSRSGRGRGRRVAVRLIGTSALVVLVGVGGTMAYARYVDPTLRNRFDAAILSPLPTSFSDWLLDQIFGSKSVDSRQQPQQQLSIKEKAMQSGLLQKKLAREAAAAREEAEKKSLTSTPVKRQPTVLVEDDTIKKTSATMTSSTSEKVDQPVSESKETKPDHRRISVSDSNSTLENEALENLVRESVRDLETVVLSAIGAYEQATRSIRLDAKDTSAVVLAAETKAVEARAALQRIKDVVQQGRKSKLTSSNRALIDAEEVANRAIYGLQRAEAEMTLAGSETNVLNEYKKLAEEGRQKVLPEMNVGDKDVKLSEEDISRQVELLRQQIVAQQNGEKYRVQKALDSQRQEYERLTNRRLDMELERLQRELEIVYQKKLGDLNDDYEQELLQQLRRQTAAHTEHLQDVLQIQQTKLAADYGRRLEDHVLQTKHEFQTELSGSLGRLEGINSALEARAELDVATHRAQRLWVACQALRHSIISGKPLATTCEEQRKPLTSEVAAIRHAAGNGDRFVSVILGSVPHKALSDGVFTESALKDRFFRVNDACRRVALVGEQGGSLYRYALSYIQSMLLVNNARRSSINTEDELADSPSVDVDALDTFEILDRARHCLDGGNLELALRYMNQLRGAPRAVARDWLTEARLLLEVSQVTDALLARAAATEVQSVAQ